MKENQKSKIKNQKFIAIFILASIALPVSAQIVPACGADGTGPCTLCDFWKLGNNIINFLLWTLAIPVLTVVLLWGGATWATSAGSPGQVTRGKQIMTTGLVGILIALSAWLIVDTIIKTLAADGEFKAAWNKFPDCAEPIKIEPVASPLPIASTETWAVQVCSSAPCDDAKWNLQCPAGSTSCNQKTFSGTNAKADCEAYGGALGGTQPTHWRCVVEAPAAAGVPGCPSCVVISGAPIKPSNACEGQSATSPCKIDASMLPKLQTLDTHLQSGEIIWEITEAWPPTGYNLPTKPNGIHSNNCHGNGTCVDAAIRGVKITNPVSAQSPFAINKFFQAAGAVGLRAVYEVETTGKRDALISSGVTGEIQVVSWITGEHFSVYNK